MALSLRECVGLSLHRKAACKDGRNLYLEAYRARMSSAPYQVWRFADPQLCEGERQRLLSWLRDLDDVMSSQSLQLAFSFSVPSEEALSVCAQFKQILSMGAGAGYWEHLLQRRGVEVAAFDSNDRFPEAMRYTFVANGGPSVLDNSFTHHALFLSWPDVDESSTFGLDCLTTYTGSTVIHVGELLGETCSTHIWGQTSSSAFQLALAESFCCVQRLALPRWPGNFDSLSVWRRKVTPIVQCDGVPLHCVKPVTDDAG